MSHFENCGSKSSAKSTDMVEPISSLAFKWSAIFAPYTSSNRLELPVNTGVGIPPMIWTFSIDENHTKVSYKCETQNGERIPLYLVECDIGRHKNKNIVVYTSEIGSEADGYFEIHSKYHETSFEIRITLKFYGEKRLFAGVMNFPSDCWNFHHEHTTNMHLLDMLKSGHQSDVKIISREKKVHPAHKLILTARNEVFEAMFCHDMVESNSGVVTFKDMSACAVKFLLNFIYTSQIMKISAVENDKDGKNVTMEEVLYLAAQFRLQELMTYLDKHIIQFCNEKNAWHLFKLCKLYSLGIGKNEIFNFMVKTNPSFVEDILTSQA